MLTRLPTKTLTLGWHKKNASCCMRVDKADAYLPMHQVVRCLPPSLCFVGHAVNKLTKRYSTCNCLFTAKLCARLLNRSTHWWRVATYYSELPNPCKKFPKPMWFVMVYGQTQHKLRTMGCSWWTVNLPPRSTLCCKSPVPTNRHNSCKRTWCLWILACGC